LAIVPVGEKRALVNVTLRRAQHSIIPCLLVQPVVYAFRDPEEFGVAVDHQPANAREWSRGDASSRQLVSLSAPLRAYWSRSAASSDAKSPATWRVTRGERTKPKAKPVATHCDTQKGHVTNSPKA